RRARSPCGGSPRPGKPTGNPEAARTSRVREHRRGSPAESARRSPRGLPRSTAAASRRKHPRLARDDEMPPTRSACPRGLSSPTPLFLVVVAGIEINRPEEIGNARLLTAADVLLERLGDGFLLGGPPAYLQRLFEQLVVEREVGRHLHIMPHMHMCGARMRRAGAQTYSATGGQEHIRLRSPYGLSIRPTDGQCLFARTNGSGNAASSREYGWLQSSAAIAPAVCGAFLSTLSRRSALPSITA